MHYELRLYPAAAVSGASRRASSAGTELDVALQNPERVLSFDTISSMAAAALTDHGDLVGLTYAVENDGTARPVSATELARAVEAEP